MSATLMNLEPKATQPRSSKYLASAMLFGSVYFLLSYLCPGEQVSTLVSWPIEMNLLFGLGLAVAFLGYGFVSLKRSQIAEEGLGTS
jgi:hypothetical protein